MPPKLAVRFRAICVAVALVTATASTLQAASAKQDPLIGQTREQVLAHFGEPKNTIVAGNREVLFFDRDRITLRDNVVIAAERLPEPTRRAPEPAAPGPSTSAATAPASDSATTPRRTGKEAEGGETPLPVVPTAPAGSAAKAGGSSAAAPATSTAPATPAPDAPLEIKVRSAGSVRPTPKAETPPPVVASTPTSTAAEIPTTSAPPATTTPLATPPPAKPGADLAKDATTTTPAPAATATETAKPADAAATPTEPAKPDEPAPTPADDTQAKAKKKGRVRHTADGDIIVDEPVITGQTYFIAAVTIGVAIAYLYWRNRQRQLELAASAVSRTPFSAPVAATGGGAIFTAELIGKLEWKRFEELVAAYYSKTGVVAARTKSGPKAPVHIKISWKGEPRPFALVQCLSGRAGLIDATPLQELVTALAAEDIRRGYVVTTGKFNVAARDFAEEKHITLLPGDILLEKINALPEAARNELMTEVTTGDNTTPSCPICEAKMVKNPDDSSQWRCATHTDQVFPVK